MPAFRVESQGKVDHQAALSISQIATFGISAKTEHTITRNLQSIRWRQRTSSVTTPLKRAPDPMLTPWISVRAPPGVGIGVQRNRQALARNELRGHF